MDVCKMSQMDAQGFSSDLGANFGYGEEKGVSGIFRKDVQGAPSDLSVDLGYGELGQGGMSKDIVLDAQRKAVVDLGSGEISSDVVVEVPKRRRKEKKKVAQKTILVEDLGYGEEVDLQEMPSDIVVDFERGSPNMAVDLGYGGEKVLEGLTSDVVVEVPARRRKDKKKVTQKTKLVEDLGYGEEVDLQEMSSDVVVDVERVSPNMAVDLGYGDEGGKKRKEKKKVAQNTELVEDLGYGEEVDLQEVSLDVIVDTKETSLNLAADMGYGGERKLLETNSDVLLDFQEASNLKVTKRSKSIGGERGGRGRREGGEGEGGSSFALPRSSSSSTIDSLSSSHSSSSLSSSACLTWKMEEGGEEEGYGGVDPLEGYKESYSPSILRTFKEEGGGDEEGKGKGQGVTEGGRVGKKERGKEKKQKFYFSPLSLNKRVIFF